MTITKIVTAIENAIDGVKVMLKLKALEAYKAQLPNPINSSIERWKAYDKPCKY